MNQKAESDKTEGGTKVPPPGKTEVDVTKYPSEVAAFGEVLKASGVAEERIPAILDYCSQEDLRDLEKLDTNLWDMGIANVHQRRRIIKYWSRSTGIALPKQLISAYAEQTKTPNLELLYLFTRPAFQTADDNFRHQTLPAVSLVQPVSE